MREQAVGGAWTRGLALDAHDAVALLAVAPVRALLAAIAPAWAF